MHISDDQLRAFAERGYVVIPNVVSQSLIGGAMQQIDRMIEQAPPPSGYRGFHFYWEQPSSDTEPLTALVQRSNAWKIATSLVVPRNLEPPEQIQVSLNIPVWYHQPGGPHIDGLTPPEPSGRPGTFTVLAGIFLTDQMAKDMGNLWVWPGSHHIAAAFLRRHGADALFDIVHPTYPMASAEQVLGQAGDLFLGHYLLGHNIGGNNSVVVRRVVYFRLHAEGHRTRWRECVQDPLFEFDPARAASARNN